MSQKTTDWRGQPIEVGTKVIYHRNHSGIATWGIGKVTGFRSNMYSDVQVDIDWEEHTGDAQTARGVSINHCTAWPKAQNLILRDANG